MYLNVTELMVETSSQKLTKNLHPLLLKSDMKVPSTTFTINQRQIVNWCTNLSEDPVEKAGTPLLHVV